MSKIPPQWFVHVTINGRTYDAALGILTGDPSDDDMRAGITAITVVGPIAEPDPEQPRKKKGIGDWLSKAWS